MLKALPAEARDASPARADQSFQSWATPAEIVAWQRRGELVAFLDSDCLAEPNWIEELVVGVMHDPQVGAVTGLVLDPPPKGVFTTSLPVGPIALPKKARLAG